MMNKLTILEEKQAKLREKLSEVNRVINKIKDVSLFHCSICGASIHTLTIPACGEHKCSKCMGRERKAKVREKLNKIYVDSTIVAVEYFAGINAREIIILSHGKKYLLTPEMNDYGRSYFNVELKD